MKRKITLGIISAILLFALMFVGCNSNSSSGVIGDEEDGSSGSAFNFDNFRGSWKQEGSNYMLYIYVNHEWVLTVNAGAIDEEIYRGILEFGSNNPVTLKMESPLIAAITADFEKGADGRVWIHVTGASGAGMTTGMARNLLESYPEVDSSYWIQQVE